MNNKNIPKPPTRWIIYDNQKDYPNLFVARCFVGLSISTDFFASSNLLRIREIMVLMGLTRMGPIKTDDPCVLEVWF